MTVAYRDSSFDRPNAAQAKAAYAAGVRVWGGYLAAVVPPSPRSAGGSNLATSWTQADFDVLRAAGISPIAFASGWDDPEACGALARAWGVRLMLDVEDGIRGDGPWVDDWLARSGAGIYGLCEVHYHVAPAHIVARYPGVPVAPASWDPQCPVPAGLSWVSAMGPLLGWQAEGTHTDPATGLQVDGGWVDDGFVEVDMTENQAQQLADIWNFLFWGAANRKPEDIALPWIRTTLDAVRADQAAAKSELASIVAALGELQSAGVPPAQLQPVLDALARLSAHLGVGMA